MFKPTIEKIQLKEEKNEDMAQDLRDGNVHLINKVTYGNSIRECQTTGAVFMAKEVGEILDMDDVVGVAEIMDYVGVIQCSDRMTAIIEEGVKRGMFLQGHAPFVTGAALAAYRIGGPVSDHESTCAAEVTVDAGDLREGDTAGLCLLIGSYGLIGITRERDGQYLMMKAREVGERRGREGSSGSRN